MNKSGILALLLLVASLCPFVEAFGHLLRPRAQLYLMCLDSSISDDEIEVDTALASPAPTIKPSSNPFLSLLSNGLHKTSIAMNKDTSDQVFKSTPSLQRLRRQVQQLTHIGPSSLVIMQALAYLQPKI